MEDQRNKFAPYPLPPQEGNMNGWLIDDANDSDLESTAKVKYAASSFIGKALTWWNTQVQARGRDVANAMAWNDFKALLTTEFCPSNEIVKVLQVRVLVARGLAGYYRRFIENFSKIAKPLTSLTQKNQKYEWGKKQEEAFQTLKDNLCNAPILSLPDGVEDFVVYCDASNQGLGCVLMQRDKVIAYASRQLKSHKKNYTTHDLELGVPSTHIRSEGVECASFSDYECEIKYRPGKANVVADALSRKERVKPRRVRIYWQYERNMYGKKLEVEYSDEIVACPRMYQTSIIFDRDGRFTVKVLANEAKKHWETCLVMSTAYLLDDANKAENIHLPLAEFSYNNNYHSRIRCAPFEALYGRKCRSPVLWAEIGDSGLIGPELVQETTDKVVVIRDKLKAARDRQKSYANNRKEEKPY
ncbi:putative reverse transcriptase domain-containing protein [Tanacetum coccineum]